MSEVGRSTLGKAREAIEGAVYGTALYRISLRGRRPAALAFGPSDPWPGDAERGAALMAGAYRFAGQTVSAPEALPGEPPWDPEGASESWLAGLHGFDWLRDLAAAGGREARDRAQALVGGWVERCGVWRPLTWRADVLGRRLAAWLNHSGLLLGGTDRKSAEAILASLGEQARHLGRVAAGGPDGAPRIAALKGLVFAALCLPGDERRLAQALRLLEHEIDCQVLADGGHAARSPSVQLGVFRDLVEVRGVLAAAHQPVPDPLQHAIDRMAPMLRFFRHGDGGLALFNDSSEEDPALIDVALALGRCRRHGARQRTAQRLRTPCRPAHPGYRRCRRADGAGRRPRPWRHPELRDERRQAAHNRQLRRPPGQRRGLARRHAGHRRPLDGRHRRRRLPRTGRRGRLPQPPPSGSSPAASRTTPLPGSTPATTASARPSA